MYEICTKKGYYELLITLCVIIVHNFVHTSKCDHINQVCMKPVHIYPFLIKEWFRGKQH